MGRRVSPTRSLPPFLQPLASLKFTLFILAGLMIVIFRCTMDQVHLGIHWAVEQDVRSWVIWWTSPAGWRIPVFPGGGLLGGCLLVNLSLALWSRFVWTPRKFGLWLVHIGLIVMVAGEFVTGFCQVETKLTLAEGEALNYSESYRDHELVIIETTNPDYDQVFGVPEALLRREDVIRNEGLPFEVRVLDYYRNADLFMLASNATPRATQGIGLRVDARLRPRSTTDDPDLCTAFVELVEGGRSLGVWLMSVALGSEQTLAVAGGRTFRMQLRPRRDYVPYTITLKDFQHDVYAGTDVPRNYSSFVHLADSAAGENRDVRIYMNHPLRYRGRTYYQAGFAENDTVSILQVVQNPGWTLPYVSFVLVSIGMGWHFILSFMAFRKREEAS